ncbi:MAG: phosphoglycerate kinase [Verrucomicrobiota bacterium]|nr:phosphoglycerate kinase [Verrucomicrobiota bacterium]
MNMLRDLSLQDAKVLLRIDANVPLSPEGEILDETRLVASLESIRYLLSKGAALILISHLGRPKGKKEERYSLRPVAERLSLLLGQPVPLAPDCIGPAVAEQAALLRSGELMLLENVRFHIGEEEPEKDPSFVQKLALLGDTYVNDAFGTAHRKHSSTALLARYFPGRAAAGFLMARELQALSPFLSPKRPFDLILGGAKVSTKAKVLKPLLDRVDHLFLGGGMVYTFLKAQGIPVGDSLVEESAFPLVKELLLHPSLQLPVDLTIANRFVQDAEERIIDVSAGIPSGWQGMGVGPKTVEKWASLLEKASMIFWNGPLSVYEFPRFATVSEQMVHALSRMGERVVVGGGDSVAMIQRMEMSSRFSYLSTGGGATLEFLAFGHLPGVDSLEGPSHG